MDEFKSIGVTLMVGLDESLLPTKALTRLTDGGFQIKLLENMLAPDTNETRAKLIAAVKLINEAVGADWEMVVEFN